MRSSLWSFFFLKKLTNSYHSKHKHLNSSCVCLTLQENRTVSTLPLRPMIVQKRKKRFNLNRIYIFSCHMMLYQKNFVCTNFKYCFCIQSIFVGNKINVPAINQLTHKNTVFLGTSEKICSLIRHRFLFVHPTLHTRIKQNIARLSRNIFHRHHH